MTIEIKRLTNSAFGFPQGERRRVNPIALACIHITGNKNTSAMDEAHPGSGNRNEVIHANRADSPGPSAHLYIARDGNGIEAIAPSRFAAWSNGDVNNPSTTNPGVARVVAFRNKGFNANEAYWEEIECVGSFAFPITKAQIATCAQRVARRSAATGIQISRETVHGHFEINGIDRQNDPAPKAKHEAVMVDIVTRAKAILAGTTMEPLHPAEISTPIPQFGATTDIQGDFVVIVAVARRRTSPRIEADNILPRRLKKDDHFHVGQTTETGTKVAGSRRWHGDNAGSIWMHSSLIRPA